MRFSVHTSLVTDDIPEPVALAPQRRHQTGMPLKEAVWYRKVERR
jgi:hypothetical protein